MSPEGSVVGGEGEEEDEEEEEEGGVAISRILPLRGPKNAGP